MSKKNYRNQVKVLTEPNFVKIEKRDNISYYQIGDHITTDVAEAVSIMMKTPNIDDHIWNLKFNFISDEIDPRRCLYWLSGGDREWILLENYNKPWNECESQFESKYSNLIFRILEDSETLKQIKESFDTNLNMLDIYEFSLSINLIK